jgi:hypothetical protein
MAKAQLHDRRAKGLDPHAAGLKGAARRDQGASGRILAKRVRLTTDKAAFQAALAAARL